MSLTLDALRVEMAAGIDGIQARFEPGPLDVRGDGLAPATYGAENPAATKYVLGTRHIGKNDVRCALPDRVVSQEDSIELGLIRSDRARAAKGTCTSMVPDRSEDPGAVTAGGRGR